MAYEKLGWIGAPQRDRFQQLQALDDAIAWRRARLAISCPDCGPVPEGQKCDDHACDLDLIAAYQQRAIAISLELSGATPAQQAGTAPTPGPFPGGRDNTAQWQGTGTISPDPVTRSDINR
jgi:hypothetical protein